MMRRLTTLLLTFVTLFSLSGILVSAPALAADSSSKSSACAALNQLDSSQGCGSGASDSVVSGLVSTIVTILSYILGVVAIIMIIVAGLRYVTSGGASDKISSAKNTLIYAIVGLIVASLAQFIVHFVLDKLK